MSNNYERLESDDVVSVNNNLILVNNPTFIVSEFRVALREMTLSYLKRLNREQEGWFGEGIDCKILKPGAKGWQKAKVRISLEFCPDEPDSEEVQTSNQLETIESESSLDEIRRLMNEDS